MAPLVYGGPGFTPLVATLLERSRKFAILPHLHSEGRNICVLARMNVALRSQIDCASVASQAGRVVGLGRSTEVQTFCVALFWPGLLHSHPAGLVRAGLSTRARKGLNSCSRREYLGGETMNMLGLCTRSGTGGRLLVFSWPC